MQKRNIWIGLIVLVVIAGAIYGFTHKSANTTSTNSTTSTNNSSTQNTETSSNSNNHKTAAATITYSNNGFSPSTTTVKAGDTVAIKNTSSGELQFDSDPHPAHTDDSDLNVGTVSSGETKTFVVTKTGTFGFHNHLNSGDTATIIVK